jgi:hypothetical protein
MRLRLLHCSIVEINSIEKSNLNQSYFFFFGFNCKDNLKYRTINTKAIIWDF